MAGPSEQPTAITPQAKRDGLVEQPPSRAEGRGKAPNAKLDAYVEHQLQRAGGRVRLIDVTAGVLVVFLALATYATIMLVLDFNLVLPVVVRLVLFGIFFLGMLLFAAWQGLGWTRRRVNPYYAARQLEKTLPDAKESVVTYLDMRDRPLPPVLRSALAARAAKDLNHADLDRAFSVNRNWWLLGGLAVLLLPVVFFFVTRPLQTPALLMRAFLPFLPLGDTEVGTATQLHLVEPNGGDCVITEKQRIDFKVKVTGYEPAINTADALRLHYRYNSSDPYAEQLFSRNQDGEWTTSLLANQLLGNRVYYKITGGDAETPEYLIQVRSEPHVQKYLVTYRPRKYLRWTGRTVQFPNENKATPFIKDFAGTEVLLHIEANRPLKEATLELVQGQEKQEPLEGKLLAGNPRAARFQFTLRQAGTFRVTFTSKDGETNSDVSYFPLDVLKDTAPVVRLTKPGKNIELPANGMLSLQGDAEDDVGIKQITLRLQLNQENQRVDLEPKVYRAGKSFERFDGSLPDFLEYKDFVDLAKLKLAQGGPVELTKKMEIVYWLEAVDASDFPKKSGNVGRTKDYKVTITAPEKDKNKVARDKQQAAEQQQQHNQQQDQELQQQEKDRKEGQGDGQASAQDVQDQSVEKKADQIRKAAGQEKQDSAKGGQGKEAEPKGASKGGGERGAGQEQQAPKQGKPGEQQGASEKKDKGQGPEQKSQAKDNGGKKAAGQEQQPPGASKNGGEQGAQTQAKGTDQPKEQKGGASASAGKAEMKNNQSQAKSGQSDKSGSEQHPSQAKQDNGAGGKKPPDKGAEKQGGSGAQQSAAAKGEKAGSDTGGPPGGQGQQQDAGGSKAGTGSDQAAPPKQHPDKGTKAAHSKTAGGAAGAAGPAEAKGDTTPQNNNAGNPGQGSKSNGSNITDAQLEQAAKNVVASLEKDLKQADQKFRQKMQNEVDQLKKDMKTADAQEREKIQRELEQFQKVVKKADPKKLQKLVKDMDQLVEVAKMERDLQKADPKQRDKIERDLKDMAGQPGQSPEVQEAAKDALKRAKEKSTKQKDPDQSTIPGDGNPQKNDNTKKEEIKGKNPEGTNGRPPEATSQVRAAPKGDKANANFAKKGGDLQLEDLRKILADPKVLKKLKWTDDDVRRFLDQARDYQRRQVEKARQADAQLPAPGSNSSQLSSFLPQQAKREHKGNLNPVESGQALPPPEFSESYRRLTSSPAVTGAPNKE